MRLVGPNCLGILNTAPSRPPQRDLRPGRPHRLAGVGFVTQSGALGLALIDLASDRGLGVSSFASIGNRADITANDFLEYWESDDATRVALLYIESFSDPRRFSRVARRRRAGDADRRREERPLGRRPARDQLPHRRPAGGLRRDRRRALRAGGRDPHRDAWRSCSTSPRCSRTSRCPTARGSGSSPTRAAPGSCARTPARRPGSRFPSCPRPCASRCAEFLPSEAGLLNPVDMIATATAEHYRETIRALADWDGIDALIVIFIRPLLTRAEDVAAAIREAVEEMPREIPVQAVFMSPQDHAGDPRGGGVPTYLYPEDAARALGRVMRHVDVAGDARREEPPRASRMCDSDERCGADRRGARTAGASGWRSRSLRACSAATGSPSPTGGSPATPEAAGRGRRRARRPGGAEGAGTRPPPQDRDGRRRRRASPGRGGAPRGRGDGRGDRGAPARSGRTSSSRRWSSGGVELLVGVVDDATFGPVLACGAGGTQAELLKDVSVRICPDHAQRRERDAPLARDLPPPDRVPRRAAGGPEALEELLLRVSAMVEAHHEIAEMDLNPVVAGPGGAVAVDYRIRLQGSPPQRPWPRTWK